MKKIFDSLKKVEEIVLISLLIIMTVVIFIATVARFTNLFIISWAEELSRYCMIWLIFIGIGVAAKDGEHFKVDALALFLPKKVLNLLSVINAVIVFGFCGFAAYYGVMIIQKQIGSGQITPSLNWPMWIIYLAIPVGLFIMAICFAYQTYEQVTGKAEEESKEAEIE